MRVEKISLRDFRCYREAQVLFDPGVNIICGPNAAGKTNLLESVYYFSAMKPLRAVREKDMVRYGCDFSLMEAEVFSGGRKKILNAAVSSSGGKRLTRNGVRLKSSGEMLGDLRTVVFSPDDLYIVKGAPAERRRLLDRAICQLRPSYYTALSEYNKIIAQKQKILRAKDEKPSLLELLPSYNDRLASYAGVIISVRSSYAEKLSAFAKSCSNELSGGKDVFELEYRSLSNIKNTSASKDELSDLVREHLQAHYSAELASGSCLSGPHRDDLLISVNGSDAKAFASQGQTRTAALSLKLAEREIFFRDTGEYPVLLLDDVLSELDPERQSGVLNRIKGGQVIITCCSREAELLKGRRFSVVDGRVFEVSDI
ncbi:MAG: DNA replication/repair protein RecF [Clostridia bacterium]|nr:DNA replication/repair protein RecF [Clostridia bacterium]